MLLLYKLDGCPYCSKVIDYMNKEGITYKAIEVSDSVNNDELLHLGGKDQVPFIFDTDTETGMYDSDRIIEYLETI